MSNPLLKALCAQLTGLILVYGLGRNGFLPDAGVFVLACIQGTLATITAMLLVSPRWWWGIHLVFMPLIVLACMLELPLMFYAGGFIVLLLIYWSTFRTQVPLFLSNRITVHRLVAWLPDTRPLSVIDIGSGTGSFVTKLARLRPDWAVTGIESAPAPYALSRWLGRKSANLALLRTDFWPHPLSAYDVVYAFLSPAPMPRLWHKASREMRPGSLLISNSFAIPDVSPEQVLALDDHRGTRLFIYRVPGGSPSI